MKSKRDVENGLSAGFVGKFRAVLLVYTHYNTRVCLLENTTCGPSLNLTITIRLCSNVQLFESKPLARYVYLYVHYHNRVTRCREMYIFLVSFICNYIYTQPDVTTLLALRAPWALDIKWHVFRREQIALKLNFFVTSDAFFFIIYITVCKFSNNRTTVLFCEM